MFKNLKNRKEGFTIIEVLIVLAIAGLIMLIVFLAVPTLRRNARNGQRDHDASSVLAGVNECLKNHNGVTTSCDTTAEVAIDTNSLSVLTTYSFGAAAYSATDARVVIGSHCNPAGDATVAGTAREVAVTYQQETGTGTTNRCLAG